MTTEEIKSIQEIQGTAGFRMIKFLAEEKIKKLSDVMQINKDGFVAEQALARQLAVETLREFLGELTLTIKPKETNKTYE